jgi:hypothetical protein
VVVLKNGDMLRGTISERKTGESVVFVMMTGEVRTIPWADVKYAGPESERPKVAAEGKPQSTQRDSVRPFVTVRSGEAPFNFRATPTDEPVTLHVHSGSATVVGHGFTTRGTAAMYVGAADSYSTICTAPCSATLPAGTHRLALSQGRGTPVESDEPTPLAGPSDLQGEYVSRQGTRIAGWIVMLGSGVAGTVLMLSALEEKEECTPDHSGGEPYCSTTTELNGTRLWGGTGVIAGGTLVGLILAITPDEARITVAPANVGTKPDDRKDFGVLPNGVAVSGRF